MPQAGFKPTKVGVTGFQLNAKRTLYLKATTAGSFLDIFLNIFYALYQVYLERPRYVGQRN